MSRALFCIGVTLPHQGESRAVFSALMRAPPLTRCMESKLTFRVTTPGRGDTAPSENGHVSGCGMLHGFAVTEPDRFAHWQIM